MRSEWTGLEAELAVVIGAGGRHIAAAEAFGRVAGFVVAQDITERVHEFGPRSASVGTMNYLGLKAIGKSLDTFCPLGPVLVNHRRVRRSERADSRVPSQRSRGAESVDR
jgi:2-keto-4-pentenoate hydratase/2-oxohepta-3-ene-1,7-dioic acid hydratase in catechol pathway